MSFLKNKYFLPVCLAGLLAGYGAAEWIMPRYFHPADQKVITPRDFITAIGSQPAYYRQTPTGNYLAGQFAQTHKDWDKANDYISRVLEKDPQDPDLQKHAMVLAMASGQVHRAIAVAKEILKEDNTNILAILFVSLEDFHNENYLSAIETLNKTDAASVAAFIIPVLKLWADTAQGVIDTSTLDKNSFYAYHAMLAANYLNKGHTVVDYAVKAFDVEQTDIRDLEKSGDLFAKLGETDKALELYESIISKGFSSEELTNKVAVLKKQEPLTSYFSIQEIHSPREGAAVVFLDMAEILLREYSDDSATIFSQMALYLNPDLDEAHVIIGNILTRYDQHEEAIKEFEKIKEGKKLYEAAQRQIADLYTEQKEDAKAIVILEGLYKTNGSTEALIQIGDIYRFQEDYLNAVKTYNRVIDDASNVPEKFWHVLYARGMAYERMKEFDKAEKDLKAALVFRPNHPYLLNYLGYSWADQGVNLDESLDMIKQAAAAKPDDGYIADSLGWVYFKLHNFESAIPNLERAVELLPYDATINDHLGDAYWRVGRKVEARFQWRRAINFSEENQAELKETLEKKLVSGLPELSDKDKEKGTMTGALNKELEENVKPAL